MDTIKQEAKRNAKLSTSIDNMRSVVMETDYVSGITAFFPAFEVAAYEHNLFLLLSTARRIPFKVKWSYRPDYVSVEYYGTASFWTLILFVNGVDSIEEFIGMDNVLVPTFDSILEVSRYKLPADSIYNVTEEMNNSALSNETRYYKKHPLDSKELNKINAANDLTAFEVAAELVDAGSVSIDDDSIDDWGSITDPIAE